MAGIVSAMMQFSPEDADIFWPIYNEYEKKKWAIISECSKFLFSPSEFIE